MVTRASRFYRWGAGRPGARKVLAGLFTLALVAPSWGGSAAAQLVGAEFQIHTFTTDYQAHPVAAADPAGGFIVVWDSEAQDGSARGVRGRRFDPDGLPLGGEASGTVGRSSPRPAVQVRPVSPAAAPFPGVRCPLR